MLEAKRSGVFKSRWEISSDGRPLAVWEPAVWRNGGTVQCAGMRYEVRVNFWGNRYTLVREGGAVVATADRVGRKRWTVQADGKTYEFERGSVFGEKEWLVTDGAKTGWIKRTSMWRYHLAAELPGLPPLTQAFAIIVVAHKWEQAAATGTAS